MGPRHSMSDLRHRPSTKQLVNRFESLESPVASPKKDKSPVRQSFRNLLGILKKGPSKLKLDRAKPSSNCQNLDLPSDPEPEFAPASTGKSGTLLYLSRLSESASSTPLLPVWTTCMATLSDNSLMLSWSGSLERHSISLSNCEDVRSLTLSQLDPEENALLPSNIGSSSEDPRVFEISFESGHKERFAAFSVRERANWVSAIWEAVLPSHQRSTQSKIIERSLPSIPLGSPVVKTSLSVDTTPTRPSLNPLSSLSSPSNSLPSAKLSLSVDTTPKRLSTELSSPSKSSSIANLSQKSMVRQRLAQMEESRSLGPPSPSPKSPTDSILDSYHSAPPSIGPLIEFFQSHATKQYDQTTNLDRRIGSLQREVEKLPKENLKMLSDIQSAVGRVEERMQGVTNACTKIEQQLKNAPVPSSSDDTRVLRNLEGIREILDSDLNDLKQKLAVLPGDNEQISEILDHLKTDGNARTLLLQQQADSARYLNELNSWLETFVHHGTSQIQSISGAVDRLCSELGVGNGGGSSVIKDLRELVQSNEMGNIAELIERQKKEQEELLRTVATELSSEIRGERLRFVEAMKEATAINVQIHVEEFKKELRREVHGMTEEVGRLYQERQTMENQIAELFAFYSKHKKAIGPPTVTRGPLPNPRMYNRVH